jgi:hypothetical protein
MLTSGRIKRRKLRVTPNCNDELFEIHIHFCAGHLHSGEHLCYDLTILKLLITTSRLIAMPQFQYRLRTHFVQV